MMKDSSALQEIRESWGGVVSLRNNMRTSIAAAATSGFGLGACVVSIADAAHNLPFIHACSVLNDSLLQLCKEGHFKCKSIFLGALVKDSKNSLTWDNYSLISDVVVNARNGIAHKGTIIPRKDCWQYIEAIENQLKSWKILK